MKEHEALNISDQKVSAAENSAAEKKLKKQSKSKMTDSEVVIYLSSSAEHCRKRFREENLILKSFWIDNLSE